MMIINPKHIYVDLGTWLRQKRIDRNLSQSQAARLLDLGSPQFLSNIERGLAGPPRPLLNKMLKIYMVDTTEFISWLTHRFEHHLRHQYGSMRRTKTLQSEKV